MEAEVLPDRRAAEAAPEQERRRLEAAAGDDDDRRLDGELDLAAVLAAGPRDDAGRASVAHEHPLDRAADDEPRAGVGGVLEIRLERRLLAPLLAPCVAVAAVTRDRRRATRSAAGSRRESPRAESASIIISFVLFGFVASVLTLIRCDTASRCASNSAVSRPRRPRAAHSSRIWSGGRRQTIELITVPPPSVAPARIPIEPLSEKKRPPRRYSSCAPTRSSWRKSASFR